MDTLMIALLLASTPARPVIGHTSTLQAPTVARPVAVTVASVQAPEKYTTCYESKNGSCWSE